MSRLCLSMFSAVCTACNLSSGSPWLMHSYSVLTALRLCPSLTGHFETSLSTSGRDNTRDEEEEPGRCLFVPSPVFAVLVRMRNSSDEVTCDNFGPFGGDGFTSGSVLIQHLFFYRVDVEHRHDGHLVELGAVPALACRCEASHVSPRSSYTRTRRRGNRRINPTPKPPT